MDYPEKVTYNYLGEPVFIESNGGVSFLDDAGNSFLTDDHCCKYLEEFLKMRRWSLSKTRNLSKISKALTKADLQERGITDEELKFFGQCSVREVTFDSILESGFFNPDQVKKAKELRSDISGFKKAVRKYIDKTTVVKTIPVEIRQNRIEFDSPDDVTIIYKQCKTKEYKIDLTFKARREDIEWLEGGLEQFFFVQQGREMVILLLLLDDMMDPIFRLIWNLDERNEGSYRASSNVISFNNADVRGSLLHEIGHYLQHYFGLSRALEGWTYESGLNSFAEKLLLLEYTSKNNGKAFSISESLHKLFEKFSLDENDPKELTEKDLFMRWQLCSRWSNLDEISNILGVYFDHENIYVNAFSEISHRSFVRYGHVKGDNLIYERYKSEDESKFEDPEGQNVFENIIVPQTKQRTPNTKLLELLCKLLRVKFNGCINLFDDMTEEDEWNIDM